MRQPGLLLIVFAIGISAVTLAQDNPADTIPADTDPADTTAFTLFEGLNESGNTVFTAGNGRNTPDSRVTRNTRTSPAFTLIGTARIGSEHSALLKHSSGEVVRVPLRNGDNVVPGHESYSVVSYTSGQVAVRFPAAVTCLDFPEFGVSCDATSNISSLSLTTADAIPVTTEPQLDAIDNTASNTVSDESDVEVQSTASRNPFTVLRERNRAAASDQAASTSRFQPPRIAPEDVPPGMRVVSTPFGDRLVEQ